MLMRTFASELVCSLGVSGLELPASGIVELVPFPVSVSVSARLPAPFDLPGSGLNVASSGLSSESVARLGSVERGIEALDANSASFSEIRAGSKSDLFLASISEDESSVCTSTFSTSSDDGLSWLNLS